MPAIHRKKEEVAALFHRTLGAREDPNPAYLAEAARQHLRGALVAAHAAITGVNFAVAETGAIVVCTNKGNADLGAYLAPLHIACMGLEKVIPRAEHLGVFLRLLARSATRGGRGHDGTALLPAAAGHRLSDAASELR
jgi:L-lactate dehydrogenase complex protein LldF